jgi:MFS family permease
MIPLRCQLGLNGLNFFSAAMQTAFGPFFTVYLTQQGWSQVDVGLALSIGTLAALVFQLPAGWVVDTIHLKRLSTAIALVLLAIGALIVFETPSWGPVLTAQVVRGFAGCLITPAIAALTLMLCGHAAFSERLGINGRYASLGTAFAAAALGASRIICRTQPYSWSVPPSSSLHLPRLCCSQALSASRRATMRPCCIRASESNSACVPGISSARLHCISSPPAWCCSTWPTPRCCRWC